MVVDTCHMIRTKALKLYSINLDYLVSGFPSIDAFEPAVLIDRRLHTGGFTDGVTSTAPID